MKLLDVDGGKCWKLPDFKRCDKCLSNLFTCFVCYKTVTYKKDEII